MPLGTISFKVPQSCFLLAESYLWYLLECKQLLRWITCPLCDSKDDLSIWLLFTDLDLHLFVRGVKVSTVYQIALLKASMGVKWINLVAVSLLSIITLREWSLFMAGGRWKRRDIEFETCIFEISIGSVIIGSLSQHWHICLFRPTPTREKTHTLQSFCAHQREWYQKIFQCLGKRTSLELVL